MAKGTFINIGDQWKVIRNVFIKTTNGWVDRVIPEMKVNGVWYPTMDYESLLFQPYETRIENDGGQIIDKTSTSDMFTFLENQGLYNDLVLGIGADYGLKLRENGSDKFVEKAYDISSKNNNPVRTTTHQQPLLKSNGIKFNSNKYQKFIIEDETDVVGSSDFTLICWIKTYITTDSDSYMLYKGPYHNENTSITFRLGTHDPEPRLQMGIQQNSFWADLTGYNQNTWYMITGTYNSTTGKMSSYINDKHLKTTTPGTGIIIPDSTYPLEIGRTVNGQIGEFYHFHRALTSQEITDIYNHRGSKYGHVILDEFLPNLYDEGEGNNLWVVGNVEKEGVTKQEPEYLYLNVTDSDSVAWQLFVTGDKIDLTNYSKLKVEWERTITDSTWARAHLAIDDDPESNYGTAWEDSVVGPVGETFSKQIDELDISNINDEKYVFLSQRRLGNLIIHRVWLEI